MNFMMQVWKHLHTRVTPGIMGFSTIHCRHKTAGLIVIGDEILRGDVEDQNGPFTCKILHDIGVKMKKVSVIGDSVREVSLEVANFSTCFDYVITTGGIGPTHDDITFEGIAEAFREPLVIHPEILALCEKHNQQQSKYKLSKIPKSAKLKYYKELKYPRITVKNVFIFPGIPQFFQRTLSVIAKDSFECSYKFYSKSVYLSITEEQTLQYLNFVVETYPDVEFGSYPDITDANYKLKITIVSSNEKSTNEAYTKLLELIPKQVVVRS